MFCHWKVAFCLTKYINSLVSVDWSDEFPVLRLQYSRISDPIQRLLFISKSVELKSDFLTGLLSYYGPNFNEGQSKWASVP